MKLMVLTFVICCLAVYLLSAAWFFCSSVIQLHLLWKTRRADKSPAPVEHSQVLPCITIQVPVYNERFVVQRLLAAIGELNYPSQLLEIQVPDDSDDDTSLLIDQSCIALQNRGLDVSILRRDDRTGFKAGALQRGLSQCRGEFIAIFDADFVPPIDFLRNMIRYFQNKEIGIVQARWTHNNQLQNSLTIVQSFLLDSHFAVEQYGRSNAGYYTNFNGTAGIWRKQCIVDAGGWNGHILSEDLELSYRAQLAGWKIKYAHEITVKADLPTEISAFKTQQFRWAKGMAQTAGKHLVQVAAMRDSAAKKLHGLFHLLGSFSFLAVAVSLLMIIPVLAGRQIDPGFRQLTLLILPSGIMLPVLCVYYYFGTYDSVPRKLFWLYLPKFLVLYMGLSIQNSIAVLQAIAGYATPFIRTPKGTGATRNSNYRASRWSLVHTVELLALGYCFVAIALSIYWQDYFLVLFLFMMSTGLIMLLTPSIRELIKVLNFGRLVRLIQTRPAGAHRR